MPVPVRRCFRESHESLQETGLGTIFGTIWERSSRIMSVQRRLGPLSVSKPLSQSGKGSKQGEGI